MVQTLFVVDPWLRKAMTDQANADKSAFAHLIRPTKFYLKGKVTVDAYQPDSGKVESPRFPDLNSLPIRGGVVALALPLQTGPGRPILAALQVTVASREETSKPIVRMGHPRSTEVLESSLQQDVKSRGEGASISESQITGISVLCTTAVGILDMRLQLECAKAVQGRARDCLAISAAVNGARSLADFEQRVKILLADFFDVACVRLCFYDSEKRELVTTLSRPYRHGAAPAGGNADHGNDLVIGRKNVMKVHIRDGAVGRAARKLDIIHVDRLISSAFVNERADGVDISGRSGEINMLVGPMVAELSDESSLLVGVVQLIEKKHHAEADTMTTLIQEAAAKSDVTGQSASHKHNDSRVTRLKKRFGVCDAFTAQDEDFLASLLRILGLAAHRTMQALAPRSDTGEPLINVGELFAGG